LLAKSGSGGLNRRSFIVAEAKNGLLTHKAPYALHPAKAPAGQEHPPQSHSVRETAPPPHPLAPLTLAAPPNGPFAERNQPGITYDKICPYPN
jgi:hypothetical protein